MSSAYVKVAKFLGPHLLSMMRDAVKRWNNEIPISAASAYEMDVAIIRSKLVHLDSYDTEVYGVNLEKMVDQLLDKPYKIENLDALYHALKVRLEGDFAKSSASYVRGLVDNNLDLITKSLIDAERSAEFFKSSMKVGVMPGPLNLDVNQQVRMIDDALLALTRIRPDRLLAPCGTLVLRDMHVIYYPDVSHSDLEYMKQILAEMYQIQYFPTMFGYNGVRLIPRSRVIDEKVINSIYGRSFRDATIASLLSIDQDTLPWFVRCDQNISPDAIINKIVGSSVSSLSTVIVDVVMYMTICLKHEGVQDQFLEDYVRFRPWQIVKDTLLFISPTDMYSTVGDEKRSWSRINSDFDKMSSLIELYKVVVSHYGLHIYHSEETSAVVNNQPVRSSSYQYPEPSAPHILDLPDRYVIADAINNFERLGRSDQAMEISKMYGFIDAKNKDL